MENGRCLTGLSPRVVLSAVTKQTITKGPETHLAGVGGLQGWCLSPQVQDPLQEIHSESKMELQVASLCVLTHLGNTHYKL